MSLKIFQDDRIYASGDEELDQLASRAMRKEWRHLKRGPAYLKLTPGNRGLVAYRGDDLNEFVEKRRVAIDA